MMLNFILPDLHSICSSLHGRSKYSRNFQLCALENIKKKSLALIIYECDVSYALCRYVLHLSGLDQSLKGIILNPR